LAGLISRLRGALRRLPSFPLRVSVTLSITALAALSYAALSGTILRLESSHMLLLAREQAETSARSLAKALAGGWDPARGRAENRRAMDRSGVKPRLLDPNIVYAVFQDPAGAVVYTPKKNVQLQWIIGHSQFPPAVRNMLFSSGTSSRVFYSYYPNAVIREFLVTVHGKSGALEGVVRIGLDESRVRRVQGRIAGEALWHLLGVNAAATLAVCVLVFLAARRFERPLEGLYRRAVRLRASEEDEADGDDADSGNVLAMLADEFDNVEGLVAQLRQNQEELANTVSHEFKAPLSVVVGYAQVMLDDTQDSLSERHREYLMRIRRSGERLLALVMELLELARIEAGKLPLAPVPIEVGPFLEEIAEDFRLAAQRKGISLSLRVPDGLPPLEGDRTLLRRVFDNFFSNGIKYNREGRSLTVSVERRGEELAFAFADEGIGMSPGDQAKLFGKFFRASNVGRIPGTGLGLAIAKAIVQWHRGRVEVESAEGRGTTFRVILPLLCAAGAQM